MRLHTSFANAVESDARMILADVLHGGSMLLSAQNRQPHCVIDSLSKTKMKKDVNIIEREPPWNLMLPDQMRSNFFLVERRSARLGRDGYPENTGVNDLVMHSIFQLTDRRGGSRGSPCKNGVEGYIALRTTSIVR